MTARRVLKQERLEAARSGGKGPGAGTPKGLAKGKRSQVKDRSKRTPVRRKRAAASRAQGARRQAKRDSR